MKQFLKTTLAVILGIIICSFLTIMFFAALIPSGTGSPVIPKGAVLTISDEIISEQTRELSGSFKFGSESSLKSNSTIGIWDAIQAVNKAAGDPEIKYIYMKPEGLSCGLAQMQELRKALAHFRESGKPVIAYLEAPTTGAYYIASVADKIYMPPYSGVNYMLNGVSGTLFFVKDLLDKFGVNVQLIRHGKYKSAGEMFIRNSSSPENMEQNQVMINSIWKTLGGEIAASRSITPEEFNAVIDELKLVGPQDFVDNKLCDGLVTRAQLEEKLAGYAMVNKFRQVKTVSLGDYSAANKSVSKAVKKMAVIYAEGDIVDGDEKKSVAGDRFAKIIAKVAADSSVSAVVLRVNSPGGSVLASEKIKTELDALAACKPLIASYGDYAASGGYWISSNARRIFCNPVTLTGSIGVFGIVPDFSGTLKNVAHVTVTPVNSNKHSDMYSLVRPFTPAEYSYMQQGIENVYEKFLTIVSQGRSMDREKVDEIGQGRVWTGSDAIEIGLVDEMGTIEDAIHYAAKIGGNEDLSQWKIVSYPKPATPIEEFMEMMGKSREDPLEGRIKSMAKALDGPSIIARLPYEINIR